METFWTPLATNLDKEGVEFISAMEAKNYPFYATQFHPEKTANEWTPKLPSIPHTRWL
jgi:gamma-glutamyl hydrolase